MGVHMTSGLDSVFAPVLVSASGDGFHAPDISDLFPPVFAFEGTVLGMDRVMMIRLVMCLVLVLCLVLYATRAKLVPGRVQTLMEMGFDFCRKNISEEIIGQELGRKYSPIITAIFFTVLFMNIAGIIPGFNLAGTAKPGFPLLLAVFSWFVFVYAGIRETGLGHFVKSSLFPPGVPWVLYILLTPIELISTFIIRPFTLFVRLLANMIAGHFLLALTLSASNYFLFAHLSTLSPLGILTFAAAFAFTLFEILVAFLQAYIFAVLTAVYVNLSVHAH
ncbi:F0F1 ATP synthase subunit A [Mobiluncus mulieris]|uniref:ATP synthase subunit a n=2 Tax=Mobiluncus mulieris TaxID=2052 RepID=E0QPE2_9ACTO|nr:F0F1 ATP synthase subunit A [Mobiluncus mulieris]EEJ55008.1 ATP synthase F0, A subunit [Mobiluncus mulieris ATCC 35243]EEZ90716.1 ATP synthase F0, A subunit [Mobiluncus mulieris 28-1]EFM46575.1 ATP synthase F0, A subunit [Mobiluncus mulieris ATCC 35239]EFN92786.1 ATP synthase F0, A subunit [Mobiluncus mulieris FB024-16]MBB5846818.1 F-type H+-transporting ATPase subunit a [Mobiluncus mulieris]